MIEVFKRQILKLLNRKDYSPLKTSALEKALKIDAEQRHFFKSAFDQLKKTGKIIVGPKNLIILPEISSNIIGIFRANPKGFGFVTPLELNVHEDVFIPPGHAADAMSGDTVSVKVIKRGKRQGQMRYSGIVTDILERATNKIVGTLTKQNGNWLVIPDGKQLTEPVSVDDVTAKNANENDKVVIDILAYPTGNYLARGVILEVLGKAGLYDSEISSVIHAHNLPIDFDQDCIDQAKNASKKFTPRADKHRNDITSETIITIDPPDAKDFDDAISLTKTRQGNWTLGIHIADVSEFVPADSPLDLHAKEKGNSIYLPRKVIPMLPEILSNGICSLQPNQPRFAKTVYITYDSQANIISCAFANSLICSTARLTYLQADAILKGQKDKFPQKVHSLLKDMEKLAKAIENRRLKNGMLELDLPETELIFDKDGKVIDACPAENSYPHKMIEMFMVEANEAVASLLDRLQVPFIRRIHPEPDAVSTKALSRYISIAGMKVPRNMDRKTIQDLLHYVKGKPISYAINILVLRSLERAEYSPLNIGHFALASTKYSHFTSPIRRYADLLVHRLLQAYIQSSDNTIAPESIVEYEDLKEIGKHITFTEQRAAEAENELKMILLLGLLSQKIGQNLECVVSGLTNSGVFAKSIKFGAEGFIALEQLGLDDWKYDEKRQAIKGKNSGKTIALGDLLEVTIVSVNLPARQMTLAPAKLLVETRLQNKRKTPQKTGRRRFTKR